MEALAAALGRSWPDTGIRAAPRPGNRYSAAPSPRCGPRCTKARSHLMAKRYEVEITFQQTVRYAVDAESRKQAEQLAMEQWKEGDEENAVGSECCDLVGVNSSE